FVEYIVAYNVECAGVPEASRMTHRLLALAAAILAGTTPALAQAPKPAQPAPAAQAKAPEAVITLEKGGEIRIELFRTDAPGHVDNFTKLAGRVDAATIVPRCGPADDSDGRHHARERWRDPDRVLPRERAKDRRELRDARQAGVLQRAHLPPRRPELRRPGRLPQRRRH